MMSKNDLIHEEKEAIRKSKESCTITTANGTIMTTEEATVYVEDLDMLLTDQGLEDSPAVLSRRKSCEGLGYAYEWKENNHQH